MGFHRRIFLIQPVHSHHKYAVMKKGKCRVATEPLYYLFLADWSPKNEKMPGFLKGKAVAFVSASGFLSTFFGISSGTPEGFRKVSRRNSEEIMKDIGGRYEEDKNIYFTEPL
jgi:hypothetical protein